MGKQLTPERLTKLADDYAILAGVWSHPEQAASHARALDSRSVCLAAAWLATPGNQVGELVETETRRLIGYQAYTGGDSLIIVGRGPTALAAVLDAIGVRL